MLKELTCIVCPKGCRIKIQLDGKKILNIEGNSCKRGYEYAENEVTNPKRTITSTVRTIDGGLVSVKTDTAIDKNLIFECMKRINAARAGNCVKIGDIIIENVLNTGINIVASSNYGEK